MADTRVGIGLVAALAVLFLVALIPQAGAIANNGTIATNPAAGASSTSQAQGNVGLGELDTFVMNLTKGARINVNVTWADSADDIDITLVGPSLNLVATSVLSFTKYEHIAANATSTGHYLLVVYLFSVRTAPRISYNIQSSVPLKYFVKLIQVQVHLSGVADTRPTNVTFVFLGTSHFRPISQSFALLVDNGTSIIFVPTIQVSNLERFNVMTSSTRIIRPITLNITYYRQFLSHLTFVGLTEQFPTSVTFTSDGHSQKTTAATDWTSWTDEGSSIWVNRTIQVSEVHRFHMEGDVIWRVDQPLDKQVLYHEQWKPIITVNGLPSSIPAAISFSSNGQSFTVYQAGGTWSKWVDDGTAVTVTPEIVATTGDERWEAGQTAFVVHGFDAHTVSYTHQYLVSFNVDGVTGAPALLAKVTQLGQSRQVPVGGGWSGWTDAGSTVSLPSTLTDGHGTRWMSGDTLQFSVDQAGHHAVRYNAEYHITLAFTTEEGKGLQPPSPTRVDLIDPEGNPVSVTSDEVWLSAGAWSVSGVLWHGANIAPSLISSFTPSPGATWLIRTQVRDVVARVSDSFGIPVAGAELAVTYPDGSIYRAVTNDSGRSTIPETYAGTTVVKVSYLGIGTAATQDLSLLSGSTIELKVPLSTPVAFIIIAAVIIIIMVIAVSAFLALRRR